MLQAGSSIADRFDLERLTGTGAMGQVWLAEDRQTGEPVALKLLAKSDYQEYTARFSREALLLSQLDHPHIVRYVAHGLADSGEPYLAMEWLEGEDLAQRLESGPLTIPETITLVRYVAQALGVAHGAGIIHRDMKPSNLFLPHGSVDAVKVVDFGVARVKDSTWTKTGLMLGTPAYMAPEQAYGQREIDARADLFGLGCIAFECVAGRSAFGGKQVFTVLRRVLMEEAPALADLVSGVPPEFDALVKRMMAKDAAARPQSAAEVDAALGGLSAATGADESRLRTPPRRVLSDREQRIVTVLSVAEEVDPSSTGDAATVIDVLQPSPDTLDPSGALRGLIERTGGTIGRCTANTFVLAFPANGLPADRATQAAECALSLAGVWRGRPMVLASGRAEVGAWTTDGSVADRASRLLVEREERAEEPAEATILVDYVTAGLLDHRFEVGEGPRGLELRGDRERAKKSDPPPAPARGTPFVGRERELDALRATLEECIEEPVARAALVTGAAGMGKSRLRREWIAAVSRPGMQIWTARGEPLRAGLPFGLVSKLTQSAKDSSSLDGAAMMTQSQDRWVEFIASECKTGPLLIVLEDLQWGDALSLKMLDVALRDLSDSPLMMVGFARPEVHQLFPRLWSDRPIEEIRLTPLTKSASERLVRGVLREVAAATDVARIVEQADGVPLYLEALARAAARGGGDQVPDPVLAMVQSRFEKFGAHQRRILRAASVFGRTFWRGGVLALVGNSADVDDALQELADQKLIARRAESRFSGEQEFDFTTTLIRDSAYAMLTDTDQALGHDLAASWLERAGESDASVITAHRELGGRRPSEIVERHAAG